MAPVQSSARADYAALERGARARHLRVLGGFHPAAGDSVPGGNRTFLLLGPDEPRFWPYLKSQPEWTDPDPVDRWSERVIGRWAADLGATALFPFDGPPYHPFFTWALRTGRIHTSPIFLLVHDEAGLMVSFRGALALPWHVDLPEPPASPCTTCEDKPCTTACPVEAFVGDTYDVPACRSFLDTDDGQDCMMAGCRARRVCPVSRRFGRLPEQSAHHMARFKSGAHA